MRLTPSELHDDVICRVRDEARAIDYIERVRCCNAALGIPTSDGAGGLLDTATCRWRIAAIVNNNLACGLNTYGVADENPNQCLECGSFLWCSCHATYEATP